ncbi:Tim44 domain-containing protein [Zwartia vadi]|uniref:Tim44 domain-containing protein n=1 Tax=Zwartia vadi TaxID=3058168 RepID=UPI0025B4B7D5|nr:TIM44-like domain-containing protein [Zwartia vadi]MDN3987304.1 TIM44-like domain-containing protein [Zwartia vadi]
MSRPLIRFFAAALVAVSGLALTAVTFDAEAARVGKGSNAGRQSTNVTSQKAAQPAATSNTTQRSAAAAPAAGAAGTAAASGASRWLGPLAGIAAGLGIAALLSHLGLGGALADFLVLALIAGVVVFGVMFILRRMRGPQPAAQGAGMGTRADGMSGNNNDMFRQSNEPVAQAPVSLPASATGSMSAAGFGSDAPAPDQNWFIPADFDTQRFLSEAKKQFVSIQKVWDSGNIAEMRNFLTDDLMKELQAQLNDRVEENHTEVVLLNAELLGIEKVSDGHLASVRFSGMLREQAGAEAFRFEEVWNLFKPEQGGWLLAGIQQVPVSQAS